MGSKPHEQNFREASGILVSQFAQEPHAYLNCTIMRGVVQRVREANVSIDGKIVGSIRGGLLILVGMEEADTATDIEWISGKMVRLRIFPDENGVMNKSVQDINGEILLISQFTLFASIKKGNRPSYSRAAKSETAIRCMNN
jgi:D-tyrosyl-tRNA(Tyr) deacylase